MESESTPRHPIRVVARRTGLTPATIRAWERRYDAVSPGRSEGGQRLYSDSDLARLDTLRRLTEMGRSISSVAALAPADAAALLAEDRASTVEPPVAEPAGEDAGTWATRAYAHLRRLDDGGLDRALRRALTELGAPRFLEGVAVPLLERVGMGWEAGEITPAQEHLGSAVVERILSEIGDHSVADEGAHRLVVATLPGERHALGARLVAAAASLEGWRVSYLGVDLPPGEIAAAARALGARVAAVSIVGADDPRAIERALRTLRADLEGAVEVVVGGRGSRVLSGSSLPSGVSLVADLDGLRARLRNAR